VSLFRDRREAGRRLAARLKKLPTGPDPLVLALPRGGVPVAYEVAAALDLPLDVFLVRKLGLPGHEELAMGAIASGGVRVLNDEVVGYFGVGDDVLRAVEARERRLLETRERLYRGERPAPAIAGHSVLVVDDGLATGSTMKAAVAALRQEGAARVLVAVPVAPADTVEALSRTADEVIAVETPEPFEGVGRWYRDFSQTTDEEVRSLLAAARPALETARR